jgi:hypothetical protein
MGRLHLQHPRNKIKVERRVVPSQIRIAQKAFKVMRVKRGFSNHKKIN